MKLKPSKKLVGILLGTLGILVLLWYGFSQAMNLNNKVSTNWDVIQFSLEHPSLVRNIEQDYASKSATLDASYTHQGKTPEEKLLEQVSQQLQSK